MSGGSYDYIHCKIDDAILRMKDNQNEHPEFYREKAINISEAFSEFIRTIEWVDSGDYSPIDALDALSKFKEKISGDNYGI